MPDVKISIFKSEPADKLPSIEEWRNALKEMPEWDSLPDDVHRDILKRLKNTAYPTEPSGHTTWKHVKAMLAIGGQPEWAQLITATFIWRVKRRAATGITTVAMPDTFVNEAAFREPPINISNWPTKGKTAAWEAHDGIKPDPAEEDVKDFGLWVSKNAAPLVAPPARAGSAGSGTADKKRARPADEEDPTAPPDKKNKKIREFNHWLQDENEELLKDVEVLKKQQAETAKDLSDLRAETATFAKLLQDLNEQLVATSKKLEETAAEMRTKTMSNRQCVRRIVDSQAKIARVLELSVSQMQQEHAELMENVG